MIFVLSLFFTLSTFALSLGQFQTVPGATDARKWTFESGKISLEKRTNAFDLNRNLKLGKFQAQDEKTAIQNDLKLILQSITLVDKNLKRKGKTFNDLSNGRPHEPFFQLNEYFIYKSSRLYSEIEGIIRKLEKLNWKHLTGIELSEDYKKQKIINGETSDFDFAFSCDKEKPPTACYFKDFGRLLVK